MLTNLIDKHRMYIDESGNPHLESSDDPNHRFLSLTGVIISLKYVRDILHSDMETIKEKHFGAHPDEPIVFHRKELLNAMFPFQALKDLERRERFDKELIASLNKWNYTVITVCLDKKKHKEIYSTWRYDPYHYCLEVLLERFNFWLNRRSLVGDVMAESRGGKEDLRLKKSYRRLLEQGTNYVAVDQFHKSITSKELKVRPKSANISGLQLADILAYPSRAEILNEKGLFGRPLATFSKKIIEILKNKYDVQKGVVVGRKFI